MKPSPALPPIGDFRLILFDCDGTLIDSGASIVAAMQAAFLAFDQPPPEAADIRRRIGLSLEFAVAHLLTQDPAAPIVLAIAERYRRFVREAREEGRLAEPLFPGIRALIERLSHPDIFLGVATGKNRRGLDHTLAFHGLADHFHTLQTGDIAASKPSPDMVLRAMAATGCAPRETAIVGDTSFDMMMARNAGASAIGVLWGYHERHELEAAGADAIIERAEDLIPALTGLGWERRP